MSRGRRSPGRSSGRTILAFALVLAAVLAVAHGAPGSSAFTTGVLGRGSSVPVADDANGLLGLDVAPSVRANATDTLVTVTDRVGHRASATVTLHAAASANATLVVNGTRVGDSATLSLADGANRTVDVAVDANATAGTTLGFDVTANGGGVTVTAPDRTTTVTT